MAPTDPVTIDRTELRLAYEFVSTGGFGENMAYLSLDTGKIHLVSDLYGVMEEDEAPEDVETSDRYLAIPHRNELDLGRDLVLRFVDRELPGDSDAVGDMFRRKGAYGRFKQLLEARGALERWHDYEERTVEEALQAWCQEKGIRLTG
jgi:hypothetical protein